MLTCRAHRPDEITLLYGSESGNAENLAKQLKEDFERRGIDCTLEAMNDVDVQDLKEMKDLVFITSTAGQGDFPRNAKEFYSQLQTMEKGSLAGVNYAVFGLGDHGYAQFNKAARDLDSTLTSLGGENIVPLALGDDRDAFPRGQAVRRGQALPQPGAPERAAGRADDGERALRLRDLDGRRFAGRHRGGGRDAAGI